MAGLVTITCPNCPRQLQVRPEHVGRKVSCKYCAGIFRVPRHTLFSCPKCLREGMVRTEYLGRKVRCKSCSHVFRARSKDALGQTGAVLEVKRLAAELAHRESDLHDLREQLDEAHKEVVHLDERARTLTDQRDYGQRTQEWSVVDDDAGPSSGEISNGTSPELPLADLDASESEVDSLTHLEPGLVRPPDLTKTRLAEPEESIVALREECSRLREELDTLRENAERTVITRDQTAILERDLQLAKADNVRLSTERAEIRRAAEELMKLVHEQETALMDMARERDESRAAFDLAEAARLALAEELEAIKSEQTKAKAFIG
jgi:DNA-directed RNA polymerase subunit RPC12/RpoP